MKLNYIPGLALRFFPGNTRELYDGVDDYTATNCKVVLMTGAAPSETELWNLSNLETFVTANQTKVVYRETTSFKFSYNGFKQQRVIQRIPIDSTPFNALVASSAQPNYTQAEINNGAIKTDNSLYALIYFPDKDATQNTAGNDLVLLIPNVGTGPDDFVSLSKSTFAAAEQVYLKNITISLFQGYQITDTVIMGDIDDPENPGNIISGPIGTKKSFLINKVFANRISEAYRDCFISKTSFTFKTGALVASNIVVDKNSYLNDYNVGSASVSILMRSYDKVAKAWTNNVLTGIEALADPIYKGYLVNDSFLALIDTINLKALGTGFGSIDDFIATTAGTITGTTQRFTIGAAWNTSNIHQLQDLIPGLIAKSIINYAYLGGLYRDSVEQLLIEQGIDPLLIKSGLDSVVPIDFNLTKYSSTFDKETGLLTIQNSSPAKLKTRFKANINNPTSEQLYIFLPRYLNRIAIENPYTSYQSSTTAATLGQANYSSISSVSFASTQKIMNGEVIDRTVTRIRQQDYTAISIGITGQGNVDLEYDYLAMIDYIDSFTVMLKVPNKF